MRERPGHNLQFEGQGLVDVLSVVFVVCCVHFLLGAAFDAIVDQVY